MPCLSLSRSLAATSTAASTLPARTVTLTGTCTRTVAGARTSIREMTGSSTSPLRRAGAGAAATRTRPGFAIGSSWSPRPWANASANKSCEARGRRSVSTLRCNPRIYIHETPSSSSSSKPLYTFSLTPKSPPNPHFAIGTGPQLDPTADPASFVPNPAFIPLLNHILSQHAVHDPDLQAQAAAFASTAGSTLGSGGAFFPGASAAGRDKRKRTASTAAHKQSGAPPSASQAGTGSAQTAGWLHLSDSRNPPDWGRIAWPEDILGSLQVDGSGHFLGQGGSWQESGTYRLVTRQGVLGLSAFLGEKLREGVERLEGGGGCNGLAEDPA